MSKLTEGSLNWADMSLNEAHQAPSWVDYLDAKGMLCSEPCTVLKKVDTAPKVTLVETHITQQQLWVASSHLRSLCPEDEEPSLVPQYPWAGSYVVFFNEGKRVVARVQDHFYAPGSSDPKLVVEPLNENALLLIIEDFDELYACAPQQPLTPNQLQQAFCKRLAQVVVGSTPWVRVRVRKYVTRKDRYDYGFTQDDNYVIRSNCRLRLHTTLDDNFLSFSDLGEGEVGEPDWHQAHVHGIVFGTPRPPPNSPADLQKKEKAVLHFFTDKSVDGFDALFTFLRTQGRHPIFKGKSALDIIAMTHAREHVYDPQNQWHKFSEKRTRFTVWSELMCGFIDLAAVRNLPTIDHFMRIYMPVEHALDTQKTSK